MCIIEKGYLFLEMMPLNDGFKVFVTNKLINWKNQKKYIKDIFSGV